MVDTLHPNLLHLGQSSPLPASPEEAKLDYVPNPRAGALAWLYARTRKEAVE